MACVEVTGVVAKLRNRPYLCVKSTHYRGKLSLKSRCEIHTRLKKTTIKQAKNIVGGNIRKLRLSQRTATTQEDLAGRLAAKGVMLDRSAIARIENGERYVLDYEAMAIAQSFRVSIELLFKP